MFLFELFVGLFIVQEAFISFSYSRKMLSVIERAQDSKRAPRHQKCTKKTQKNIFAKQETERFLESLADSSDVRYPNAH